MNFTQAEIDLIKSAIQYTMEHGYVWRDEEEEREYQNFKKLLDKLNTN
jgi:hypothetical protein